MYAANAVLLGNIYQWILEAICLLMYIGWAASTSIVFGDYVLRAFNMDPTHLQLRVAGFACITFSLLLHGTALKWGLWVQNVLGVFKIIILVVVIITGFLALGGHMKAEKPDNFRNVFDGTTTSASSFCSSLYNVGPALLTQVLELKQRLSGHLVLYWIQQRQLCPIGSQKS